MKTVRILKLVEYKSFHILTQQIIPSHIFQFIIFRNGKFYQGHNTITPAKGIKKKHTQEDLLKCATLILDYAYTTVDTILGQEDPDKFLKEQSQGQTVLEVLENVEKADKKKKKLIN
jgi:hypothetical protein